MSSPSSARARPVRSARYICLVCGRSSRWTPPAGYDACGTGFDQLTISDLGLDRGKVIEFVRTKKPTYVEFEEWVVENDKTDPETVRKHNEAVRGYQHKAERAEKMRKAAGLKRADINDAVTLNTLEDLHDFHGTVTG